MASWTVFSLRSLWFEVGALVRQWLGRERGVERRRIWVVRKVFLREGIVSDMVAVLSGCSIYRAMDRMRDALGLGILNL